MVLRMSNGYIIPTIPDILSTYGIPQIVKRVKEFSEQISEPIDPLGIVVSKYREQSTVHQNVVQRLQDANDAPLFGTKIKENNHIASAAEFNSNTRTRKQKYGYQGQVDAYERLAEEILEALHG